MFGTLPGELKPALHVGPTSVDRGGGFQRWNRQNVFCSH